MEVLFLGKNQLNERDMEKVRDLEGHSIYERDLIPEELEKSVGVIVTSSYKLDKTCLAKLPNLEFILAASSGYEYVDLGFTKEKGILVSNCPDYASISVAEHSLALMLAVSRRIIEADSNVKCGTWDPFPFKGCDLYGRTLGIVGLGRIGKRLMVIAGALGMVVKGVNSLSTREERGSLFVNSDIVSVHVPLKKETYHLIGDAEFDQMKKGVVFINTARGGVVDQQILIEHLQDGKISGAGLDVFEDEPIFSDNPLRKMNNVVLSPHIASYTTQARERLSAECYKAITSYLNNSPINVVNGPSLKK